ncbi:MAG: hypothetical protein U1F14_06150 [Steroidobacteraceae bacterium]
MNTSIRSLLLAVVLSAPVGALAAPPAEPSRAVSAPVNPGDMKAALRDLWLGHIFWVRNVVEGRLGGDPARAQVAEQQVVANAKAIASAIEPFYGKAASGKLFQLLAGHWAAISGYLDGVRAGRKPDQDAAYDRLVRNANEIATFLSDANPHLPATTLRGLLMAHGAHHVEQIRQLHARQYAEEAATWAAMKDHMLVIADALATGIAAQFPERFK